MAFSQQILTDLQTCVTNGPSAVTTTNMQAASGIIMDPVGTLYLMQTKAKELSYLIGKYYATMDPSDPNYTVLQGVKNDFV
jgi:hypothetical protein